MKGDGRAWGWGAVMALAATLIVAPAAPAGSESGPIDKKIESQQEELGRIRKEISEHRSRSQQLSRREKAVLNKLRNLDQEIDLSRQFLRELSEHEALLTQHVDSLKVEIFLRETALERHREQLAARLRQMYKRDPHYRWDIILGSQSIDQALTRYKFMKVIAEQDAAMVEDFREHARRLQVETAALTESLADMAEVRQEREGEARNLEASKGERAATLKDIRSKKSHHAKAIKELEASQKQVKDLIERLEARRIEDMGAGEVGGGEFARLKGRMSWPVEGSVIRRYGKQKHPKYGTVTFNNGIDIKAAAGAPIQAVAAGTVEFVDWIDAYGKCIILNHGGGYYTLYSHVSATFVRQGQAVGAGDVVAEVGDTGSLNGYECHFEIRHSKKALDPLTWLAPPKKRTASR